MCAQRMAGSPMHSPIVIKTGRHPHEVLILAGCLLYGLIGTVAFDAVSISSIRLLPEAWGRAFYILLAVGAAVPLIGLFRRGIEGPLYERAGLLILSALNLAFAVSVGAFAWPRGLGFVIFNVSIAAANLWRWRQIGSQLKEIAAAAAAGGAADQLEG